MSGVSVYFLVLESASRAAFEVPQGREEHQRFSHSADRYCVSLLHDQGFSAAATLSRRGVLSRLKMMAVNGAKFHAISRTLGEKLWGKSVETVVDAFGSDLFWWVGRVQGSHVTRDHPDHATIGATNLAGRAPNWPCWCRLGLLHGI